MESFCTLGRCSTRGATVPAGLRGVAAHLVSYGLVLLWSSALLVFDCLTPLLSFTYNSQPHCMLCLQDSIVDHLKCTSDLLGFCHLPSSMPCHQGARLPRQHFLTLLLLFTITIFFSTWTMISINSE